MNQEQLNLLILRAKTRTLPNRETIDPKESIMLIESVGGKVKKLATGKDETEEYLVTDVSMHHTPMHLVRWRGSFTTSHLDQFARVIADTFRDDDFSDLLGEVVRLHDLATIVADAVPKTDKPKEHQEVADFAAVVLGVRDPAAGPMFPLGGANEHQDSKAKPKGDDPHVTSAKDGK